MKEFDALLGGESSGGLTMRGYIYGKDATFSGALFLEMAIKLNKPVSKIIGDLKKEVNYNYYFSEDYITLNVDAQKVIEHMRSNLPVLSIKQDDTKIFGRNIKFLFPNRQWLLLRLSGTEPAFRVFSEFLDEKDATKLVNELKKYIEEVQDIVAKEMGEE